MQRIAVDLDEVLVPFVRPMAAWHRREMPSARKYKYVYRDMFQVSEEESQRMVRDFYKTPEFLFLHPILGSQRAMLRMRRGANKMYIVTGRQDAAREQTELWVDRNFPGIFDDVILTNSYTPMEVKKVDICRSLALDTIIDDSIDICNDCINNGIKAINFIGDGTEIYPWCWSPNFPETDMLKMQYGWKKWKPYDI
jgi:hypothetical protein